MPSYEQSTSSNRDGCENCRGRLLPASNRNHRDWNKPEGSNSKPIVKTANFDSNVKNTRTVCGN